MQNRTIGDFISRIRNLVKGVKQDAFLTDRFIYSIIRKHASWLLKREDSTSKLQRNNSIFQTLGCTELIEVDKVQACCSGIRSGCTIKRTKEKLPTIMEGYFGPVIRSVTSIDGSEELQSVLPSSYVSMTKLGSFKYNKQKYYWFLDGYLYFPNLDWDAIRIEALFEDNISPLNEGEDISCQNKQDGSFNLPESLSGELESHVMKDLTMLFSIPPDNNHDKQSPTN
jgi:hypothetical protein